MEKKPHKHQDKILSWAEGSEIEQRNPYIQLQTSPPKPDYWKPFDGTWRENYEYRIKPEPPKYPQTRMTEVDFQRCYDSEGGWVSVANAAIARAIEDGDVFTRAAVSEAVDLAIIQAKRDAVPSYELRKAAIAALDSVQAQFGGMVNMVVEKAKIDWQSITDEAVLNRVNKVA